MINKTLKSLAIFLIILGISFSNIPFYALTGLIDSYEKTSGIVDKIWLVQQNHDSDVVDKFISLRNISEKLKVQEAMAAAPTFVNKGAFASGVGALTVGVPAAYQDNDVFLLFVESANEAIATPGGWTQVTNSPQFTGTAAAAGGVRLGVFYKIVTGAQSSVSVTDTGNHTTAIIMGFRGVDTATPVNISAGAVSAATTAMSLPTVTTTVVDTFVVLAAAMDTDANSTATATGWANANLTGITERHDQTVASGVGGGLAIATGVKATAGATGATTATGSTSVTHAYLTIALKPVVEITTLATGSDPGAGIIIAPGDPIQDVDLFTLQTNSGTETITSVTVNLSTNNGVGTLAITDNTNFVLGSIGGDIGTGISAGSNVISVLGMSAVSGSATTFKVRVKPLLPADMPVPDGADYSITAPVTSWAGNYANHAGSDTNPNALTIDNNSPAGTTGAGATSGENGQSTVSWTNPGDTDFQEVYIYCKTSSLLSGEAPGEGSSLNVDATACDGTARMKYKGTVSGQIITGLTNGTPYYFRIYARDGNANFTAYSATQEVTGTPSAPAANLTISASAGSKVANVDSGATSAFVHNTGCTTDGTCAAFKLAASGGAVSVTSITVTETNASLNADTDLANAALIYDTDANYSNGTAGTFGTDATFASQAVTFTNVGLSIPNASTYYFYIQLDFANGVARPDGGLTVNFSIANTADVISDGTESGTATLGGTTTILPNVTSITYPITSPLNGSRIGQSITINGAGFGTTCDGTNNRVTIGGVGNVVSCTGTTFSDTSISITNFQYSSGDSYGGATTLLVRVGATDDNASQDMYVYPDITSLSVSEAREGDTVTINGNHFGTGAGANSVTIDGVTATGCTWSATSLTNCVVPTAINDANNSVTVRAYQGTGGSNSLYDESAGFGILPKIDSISAASFSDGGYQNGTFTLNGSHFGASAGSISVNGQTQDGTPTWGVSTITGVGIPDSGTDSGNIILTRSDTKTSNTFSTFYIYPQITSFTAAQGDGDVQTATITITGNHFGTGGTGTNILINGVNPSSVTWTSSSSLTAVDIPNAGTDSGVIVVTSPGTGKSSNNSSAFVIYPQITGTSDVPTATPDAAREYSASDSDGVFTVNGNHFGAAGTVTILGGSSTQQTTATCTGSAYQTTCVGLRVPDVAGYTGNIIITRTADTKTNTYAGFRVLPRIISTTPVNLKGGRGDTIAIAGDHLCQSGSCPSAFSATNSVNFNGGSVTSGASVWTDTSIPSIVIPGTAIDGNLNITSDTSYISNNLTFNVKFSPTVSDTGRAPSNTATGQSKNLIETGSAFTDGTDGDVQSDSEWQVDEEGTFVTPEWTDSVTNVTSVTINTTDGSFAGNRAGQTELACGTTYSWRFRYKDNGGVTSQEWSAWSNTWTFTTVPCGPDATSVTYQLNSDGARSGYSATITGTAFGTATDGNQANCAGGAGTGCVKFTVGGTATVADADVTAWSDTSISFTVNSALASDGGVAALEVTAASVADTTKLTFYIYPTVSSPGYTATFSDGGYQDGTITITGDHLGSSGATTNISFNGTTPESVGTWTSTSISTVATPNSGTDSGTITVTRASDSKASNTSSNFYIYPQIASFTNTTDGSLTDGGRQAHVVTITGNHFGTGGTTANISVNGVAPSSIGTWGTGSITTVDIPDAGNDSGIITVTSPGTGKTSNNSATFYIYPTITSFTAAQGDGDVQTATITITGNHFGTGGTGTNILINGTNPSSVTWTSSSSLTAVDIPNAGTDSGVIVVTNPTTTKSSNNSVSFYIYPQITSLTVPTAEPDAAREYLASDTNGIITVNGNHFGVAGSVTVLGSAGTQQTTGTCSGSAYQATCTGIQIPTAIANNSYTGNIIITRTADTKTNTYAGFRVLPRIISTTPVNLKGGRGDTIAIAGDHLCQSGTCPSAFSATNKVSFNGGEVTSGASVWTDSSIPSIVISGTAIDGNLTITSNTSYTSNTLTFDIKFSPTSPTNGDPAGLSDVVLNPILNGSVFSDGTDGDSHTDSDWQIDEEGTFAAPEWSETLSSVNISITVNNTNGSFANNLSGQTALACSMTYSFRARYKDNAGVTSQEWSAWSTTSTFTTALCGPNATSVSDSTEPALTDGGRIGHTIVISGTDFGTVSVGNRAICTGVGNGCVKIGGTGGQMIADVRVTAWANTSITISLSLTDLTTTYGGATTSGLIVYRDGVSDASGLTFYVYPDITSLTTPLGTNDGAREYAAADTDGIITITGNKFGTAPTGGQTVIVGGTVASYVADGTCDAIDGWTETCIKVQVPTTISDSTDSGYVIVTQGTGSNNKTSNSTDAGGAINIWPRVTGISAASFSDGGYQNGTFTLNGSHFGASAGTILVNGQAQDGTPTWGAASITGVGIPNSGTDSGNIILTKSDTKTSNTFSTFYIYPQITSFTNTTNGAFTDGGQQTHIITITGNHFGTGGGNAQILINTVAPSATTPTWGAGSITNVDIPNTGIDSGVIVVTNPTTTKQSNNSTSFYIYPQITSLTVPTAEPDAAREYLVSDTDGIITVNGNHFGVAGSVTVLGSAGTQQTTGTCSGSAYQATCTGIQIPTAISDSSYTGDIILTRTADTKTNTYSSFRVLPRIISLNPDNGITNDPIIIIGNHFCQTGTCPLAGSRSTASNNVTFFSGVQVTDGNVTAWGHGDSSTSGVNVNVPSSAATGNVVATSNSYTSNGINFTKASSAPADPTNLYQFETNTDLDEPPASYDPLTETNPAGKVAVGGGINQTNAWLRATASAGVNATLCIEVEAKTVATTFDGTGTVLATSAPGCQAFTVGTPVKLFVNVTSGLTDGNNYKWRARIKNNGTSEYGGWVNASVDGQAKSFYIDTSAPSSMSITCPPSAYTASTADLSWSPADNMSSTFTKQAQYDDNSDFSSSICSPDATCGTPTGGLGANAQTTQLTGLAPSTVYYYRSRSKDGAGNEKIEGYGISGNTTCTFTTSQAQMRTAEYIITGETGAISAATSRAFQVYITEQGSNIQNAFIELSGIAGTGGGASLTFGMKAVGSADPGYTNYDVAVSNTVATPFTILHKVNPTASGLYIAPTQATNNNLWINPSAGPSVYIASAKIVVTYYYTPQ